VVSGGGGRGGGGSGVAFAVRMSRSALEGCVAFAIKCPGFLQEMLESLGDMYQGQRKCWKSEYSEGKSSVSKRIRCERCGHDRSPAPLVADAGAARSRAPGTGERYGQDANFARTPIDRLTKP
jgi:hypothetical protein